MNTNIFLSIEFCVLRVTEVYHNQNLYFTEKSLSENVLSLQLTLTALPILTW